MRGLLLSVIAILHVHSKQASELLSTTAQCQFFVNFIPVFWGIL
jgi:hypothetical protein